MDKLKIILHVIGWQVIEELLNKVLTMALNKQIGGLNNNIMCVKN